MRNNIRETLLYKPITVVGFIIAIRTLVYGIGYLIPTTGFVQTVLFMELTTLVAASTAGLIFVVMAAFMIYALLREDERKVSAAFSLNAFLWLFALFIYIVHGTPLLGLGIAGMFAFLSGYVGFAYRNRKEAAAFNALNNG